MKQIFKQLSILGRLGCQYADQQFKVMNFNSSHHPYLLHVCNHPGITQDKLKTLVYVHPSNITRALDYLEKELFITKEPLAADKRTYRLYPTKKADEAYVLIMKTISQWEQIVTAKMTDDQREVFANLSEQAQEAAVKYFD